MSPLRIVYIPVDDRAVSLWASICREVEASGGIPVRVSPGTPVTYPHPGTDSLVLSGQVTLNTVKRALAASGDLRGGVVCHSGPGQPSGVPEYNILRLPPSVSVIMPAYKASAYMEEAVSSILPQLDGELLIGCDACQDSLDTALRLAAVHPEIRVFTTDTNGGAYSMRNALVLKSSGATLVFFDPDDIMHPSFMDKVLTAAKVSDIIRYRFISFTGGIQGRTASPASPAMGSFAIRRDVFLSTGGFMPWKCAADREYMRRCDRFFRTVTLDEPVFYYRVHSESLTSSPDTHMRSALRRSYHAMIKTNYDSPFIPMTGCTDIREIRP